MGDLKGSCGICGGAMVFIRGRYPNEIKRLVCPTCLAERMDNIREIADPNYGMSYTELPKEKLKP